MFLNDKCTLWNKAVQKFNVRLVQQERNFEWKGSVQRMLFSFLRMEPFQPLAKKLDSCSPKAIKAIHIFVILELNSLIISFAGVFLKFLKLLIIVAEASPCIQVFTKARIHEQWLQIQPLWPSLQPKISLNNLA